ncbi:hypothetical protein PV326_001052, partial [Microctonus aethiopoides]
VSLQKVIETVKSNITSYEYHNYKICGDKRIVELPVLAKNLKSLQCEDVLSLEKFVNEKRIGLNSILSIRCQKCSINTEIGPALVTTTKESCERAAAEERQLVIDNIEKLSQELPEEMVKEIYSFVTVLKSSLDDNEILLDEINNTKDENSTKFDIAVEEVVNIIISYDMGWSKRGNSRSYDSHPKNDHDCRKNFEGSAKAMEPD